MLGRVKTALARSRSLRYGVAGGVLVVVGTGLYNFGNVVDVEEDQICFVQDLRTGRIKEELLPVGRHYLGIMDYVTPLEGIKRTTSSGKFISSDQQSIPVEVITQSSFAPRDVPSLAGLYDLTIYQDNVISAAVQKELSPLLGSYTLVQWLENENDIQEQLATRLSDALVEKKLNYVSVDIQYDAKYIRDIFLYFYAEEELKEKSFYSKLFREPSKDTRIQ
jgi:hypothetical protein